MSRRPRTVHEQRVARALRTMAPGGRLASESPVRREKFTGGAPAAPLTLPTTLNWAADASYSATRGASTVDAVTFSPYVGDMLATLMVTEAAATPPTGWTLLYSHTFTHFTAYVAALNAAGPDDDIALWSMDWTGVAGLKEWTFYTVRLTTLDEDNPPVGLSWDVKAQANDGSASGTWATASNPAWVHSIPMMANEDCAWTTDYTENSNGAAHIRETTADTNAYAGIARCGTFALRYTPSAYEVGAVNGDALVWAPDNAYTHSTAGFTGTPGNASILLGTKP